MTTVSYRCSDCLDHVVSREYDVSNLSMSCPSCGEFARFVHGDVLDRFREFEASPPSDFGWERLDRLEKFVIAEGLVRRGKSLDDYDVAAAEADESGETGTGTGTGTAD